MLYRTCNTNSNEAEWRIGAMRLRPSLGRRNGIVDKMQQMFWRKKNVREILAGIEYANHNIALHRDLTSIN